VSGPLTEIETRLAQRYGVSPVVRAVGCPWCGQTGFYGRVPLLEILVSNPAFELRIMEGVQASQLQATAIASGMQSLRAAGIERVRNGETTLEEIDRELGESDAPAEHSPVAPHILIAEDDPVTRSIARAVLTKQGFRVTEASDGVAALEQIQKAGDIALVVLDLAMPRMTGQEVLQRLRGAVPTSGLPVVVLTGATDDRTEIELMEAGADDYVHKPLQPERLIARIRGALRRSEH
jgi:CheY-like chemotaxis protein